jgi:hypothetical protein
LFINGLFFEPVPEYLSDEETLLSVLIVNLSTSKKAFFVTMEFLNPQMLYGLFALAIPVVVHLFNFRRHKLVYFSDITLLENLKQQTARTNKLKHLLVLLLRLLAIAALVLAFARPYFPSESNMQQSENEIVMLYLDNSTSMQSAGINGALLDDARKSAFEIVDFFGPDKQFILLTNSFSLRQERPMNRDEMKQQLAYVMPNAPPVEADEIFRRAKSLAAKFEQSKSRLFLFSDFQRSSFNTLNTEPDSSLSLYLLPFSSGLRSNVFIDSCWLESPVVQVDMPVVLNVRLKNHADEGLKGLAVSLENENKTLAVSNTDIDAWGENRVSLSFVPETSGNFRANVRISDYPIVFDDNYFVNLNIASSLRVLELFEDSPDQSLEYLFAEDTLFNFDRRNVLQFDIQSLSQYNLVIAPYSEKLSEGLKLALTAYADAGGALLLHAPLLASSLTTSLDPALETQIGTFADTASTRLNMIMDEHPFFKHVFTKVPTNVDLPTVNKYFALKSTTSAAVLINMLNGNPFLMLQDVGQGSVFHLAVNLNERWSGLTESSLFAPLLVRMAFWGTGGNALAYEIGVDRRIPLKMKPSSIDDVLNIKSLSSGFEFIPATERRGQQLLISMADQLPEPGFYGIYNADSLVSMTAWNESRRESEMVFLSGDEVAEKLSDKGFNLVKTLSSGQSDAYGSLSDELQEATQWWWFILAALVFLIAETLILRFWKS